MLVKTVTIEVGLTLSPKQYESVRVHGAATVELAEGEDPQAAFDHAKALVTRNVKLEAQEILVDLYAKK